MARPARPAVLLPLALCVLGALRGAPQTGVAGDEGPESGVPQAGVAGDERPLTGGAEAGASADRAAAGTGPRETVLAAEAAAPREPERVRAEDVWERPARFVGRPIAFDVQLHSERASWNPMLTRFGSGEFRSFRCWSDEQLPWEERDFRYPRVELFTRRAGAAEWALDGAERYARFEVIGEVRSCFGGRPWFEVIAVKPRLRRLGEGAVIHASRGLQYAEELSWAAAIDEFERANKGGIPPRAREELERLIGECRERQERVLLPLDGSR